MIFLCRGCVIFCAEVACFSCEQVKWFFLVERLCDLKKRGCVLLAWKGCIISVCGEVA